MTARKVFLVILVLILAVLAPIISAVSPTALAKDGVPKPTEADIKSSIQKYYDSDLQKNQLAITRGFRKIVRIEYEFGAITIAPFGSVDLAWSAKETWPIKMPLTMRYYGDDGKIKEEKYNAYGEPIWYFYIDPFGEWKFKGGPI